MYVRRDFCRCDHAPIPADGIEKWAVHFGSARGIEQDIEDNGFRLQRREMIEQGRVQSSVPGPKPVGVLIEFGVRIIVHVEDDGAVRPNGFAEKKGYFVAQFAKAVAPGKGENEPPRGGADECGSESRSIG